jgi:ADP-ribosyl cyclase
VSAPIAEDKNVLDEAWDSVVGGFEWIKAVLIGEFADNRPLSALIADMLVSFVPGVVIVTSARDAVAVSLRLAKHPEKREHTMEWVVLCACLITIALPLAMAAAGVAALGMGAVVGGIAGSELGAALRAVMLLLAREGAKLVELIQFLQKFVSGNIIGFLRALKFVQYEKVLIQALSKITGKLINICKSVRVHLEKWLKAAEESSVAKWIGERTDLLKNSGAVTEAKAAIAKLADWEKRFYALQQDAIKQVPLAMAELDARLAKVLAQAAPKEAHTVASGVQVDKAVAAVPPKQVVADVPGRAIAQAKDKAAAAAPKASKPAKPTPAPPPKDKPDPIDKPGDGVNKKKQSVVDAAVAADREHVSALSKAGKIEEARAYLREKVLDNPNIAPADKPKALIDRLDVSSPKDKAIFWSGDLDAAKAKAADMGGVTLETTTGGKVADGWSELGERFPGWKGDPPPNGHDFWSGLSKQYAEGTSGTVNVVQSAERAAQGGGGIWKGTELPALTESQKAGTVDDIIYTVLPPK